MVNAQSLVKNLARPANTPEELKRERNLINLLLLVLSSKYHLAKGKTSDEEEARVIMLLHCHTLNSGFDD